MKRAHYIPKMESIKEHRVPHWYKGAKFGIFIHWGPYSVPAYSPVTWQLGEIPIDERWFSNNPYAEWYQNSIRIGYGPTYDHHVKTYGENYPYENFTYEWKAESFDSEAWASVFKESGAKYIVLTAKHHDGFCLWPSKYSDFNSAKRGPMRDIVGELKNSVEAASIKFGIYYSGLIDWVYSKDPMLNDEETKLVVDPTYAYADFAYQQVMELIDTYSPEVLWNDIGWPKAGEHQLPYIFSHYYNKIPTGVVNDRWNSIWSDYRTLEYKHGEVNPEETWEMVRGLGLSFGYNRNESLEDLLSGNELITLLVKTVSNNGNLLINIGPKADGTIPQEQQQSLKIAGDWLEIYGEGIYDTYCSEKRSVKIDEEHSLYFTHSDSYTYIFFSLVEGRSSYPLDLPYQSVNAMDPSLSYKVENVGGTNIIVTDSKPIEAKMIGFKIPR